MKLEASLARLIDEVALSLDGDSPVLLLVLIACGGAGDHHPVHGRKHEHSFRARSRNRKKHPPPGHHRRVRLEHDKLALARVDPEMIVPDRTCNVVSVEAGTVDGHSAAGELASGAGQRDLGATLD